MGAFVFLQLSWFSNAGPMAFPCFPAVFLRVLLSPYLCSYRFPTFLHVFHVVLPIVLYVSLWLVSPMALLWFAWARVDQKQWIRGNGYPMAGFLQLYDKLRIAHMNQ